MAFSTAITETYITDGDRLPLDLIIWRRYRRQTPGLLEATFDLNPHLSILGPFLPRGTVIRIPVDNPATPAQLPLIRLW